MYIRFVVGTNRQKPRDQTGVVTELRLLKESGDLPDYEHDHAEELFAYLNEHLPVPPYDTKKWPSETAAWFKDSAQEMISKFREIIAILEEQGRPVRMITTEKPGMILYRDNFQIVAQSRHF